MSPTLVRGIILLFLAMAAAAISKPSRAAHAESASSARPDSSIAVPDKKPARAKPEKPAAPLAKPEAGEGAESEDTQEDEETATDCDECVLALDGQVIARPGLARAGFASVSTLPYPG